MFFVIYANYVDMIWNRRSCVVHAAEWVNKWMIAFNLPITWRLWFFSLRVSGVGRLYGTPWWHSYFTGRRIPACVRIFCMITHVHTYCTLLDACHPFRTCNVLSLLSLILQSLRVVVSSRHAQTLGRGYWTDVATFSSFNSPCGRAGSGELPVLRCICSDIFCPCGLVIN